MPVKVNTNHKLNSYADGLLPHLGDIAVGTGTTAPVATDTQLQTQVLQKAATHTRTTTGKVRSVMRILASEGNGNALSEVGTKGTDGDLEDRATHTPVSKTNAFALEYRLTHQSENKA